MLDSNPGKRLYFLNTLPAQEVKASPGATLGLRDSERLRLVQRGLLGGKTGHRAGHAVALSACGPLLQTCDSVLKFHPSAAVVGSGGGMDHLLPGITWQTCNCHIF